MHILMLNPDVQSETESFLPAPEKRIAGEPVQKLWHHYSNATEVFHTGVWQSDVGKWRVHYTEDEYCFILEGKNTLTNETGESFTVQAGDHFVIPAGFVGTWEVVEPTRKVYVAYEKNG